MRVWASVGLVAAVTFAGSSGASAYISCGQYDFAGIYAAAFEAGEPFTDATQAAETILTMPDAVCHQDRLNALLREHYGDVVGYKAAATSPGAQRMLNLTEPVLGVFFDRMLLPNGAEVNVDDGASMIYELDLLVRVGPGGVEGVSDRASALGAIDAVIPFVELGDLMLPKGAAITGPLLQAMNAGARSGVMGEAIASAAMSEDDLAAIAGTLAFDGTVVAEADASALLGHPLDAMLWILDRARARGIVIDPGDVLSLGSMGKFQFAAPGHVEARYKGLGPEPVSVDVTLK